MDTLSNYSTAFAIIFLAALGGLGWLIQWYAKVNVDRTSFQEFIKEIRDDIKKILWGLNPETRPSESASPLRLSAYGKKISDDIQAETVVSPYVPVLKARVKGATVYGIQETCMDYARNEFMAALRAANAKQADDLEIYAYNHGIPLYDVLEVIGIVLRGQVFASLGIEQE